MKGSRFVLVGLVGLATAPGLAQSADPVVQARHEVLVMERVLEQKVQYGVQRLNDQLRTSGMPEMVLLAGAARARGTRLEGYGVFFDLEVPALRPSVNMLLSLRLNRGPDPAIIEALAALRGLQRGLNDAAMRASFERALASLEAEVGASNGPPPTGRGVSAAALVGGAPASQAVRPPVPEDPAQIYVREVRQAVIDAMFDHSGPMGIASDEWLTVGARDGMDPRFATGDPNDVPRTMLIRVRGADLTAFREGRLSREEAAGRVEVSEF